MKVSDPFFELLELPPVRLLFQVMEEEASIAEGSMVVELEGSMVEPEVTRVPVCGLVVEPIVYDQFNVPLADSLVAGVVEPLVPVIDQVPLPPALNVSVKCRVMLSPDTL